MQVNWMMHGDPQHAFPLAGTNDEIEIILVSRDERRFVQDEGVWAATGFARRVAVKVRTAVLLRDMLFALASRGRRKCEGPRPKS